MQLYTTVKQPVKVELGVDSHVRQPRKQTTTTHVRTVCVLAAFALGLWKASLVVPLSFAPCGRSHHGSQEISYPNEHITWRACGNIAQYAVECSNITVPMDHFGTSDDKTENFMIPLIRMRGNASAQNLLLNPGGPGGSGFDFLYRRGEHLKTIVGHGFHLLSFDPRGVNSSIPEAECYPDDKTRRSLSAHRDKKVIEDSPEEYAFAANLVKSCADTMGKHGAYINTPQTAADMNSILDAVGQKDMVYWGFSYGTLLGQTYAGMYPERSKRVIIDGVVNQFDWYEELASPEDMSDTFHVFEGFFKECIHAGSNCSLSSVAKTAAELQSKVLDLALSLEEEPLSVYINNTAFGLIDFNTIMYDAVFPALYKPASWYDLSESLNKLFMGNATDFFLRYGLGQAFELDDDANTFVTMNDQASGPAYWPQDRKSLLNITLPIANASLFGPAWFEGNYMKQQWAIPRTHDYQPQSGVETQHPLLILSTTYDPVCPLVSAKSAQTAFAKSQIVEVKGYGHCSLAVPSNCLAKHVRAFLYNGTVPEKYTQCEVDGPYFIKPADADEAIVPLRRFDNLVDFRIHEAQVRLAQDPYWPYRKTSSRRRWSQSWPW